MGNKTVHWELMGSDGEALKSFYSSLRWLLASEYVPKHQTLKQL